MNENIDILIQSTARILDRDPLDQMEDTYSILLKFTQEFAELIVRESIGVVNRRYMGDNNREDMEVRRCVEDLKKHFGVE